MVAKEECQQLIEAYLQWLRKGLSAQPLDNACELTTPFLDRHNDHLQIYATRHNGAILLSDDGYVLGDLKTSGVEIRGERRKDTIQTILNGFGVRVEGNQLVVEASERNLGQRIHSLVQAMLAVNDMFVMAQPHVAAVFWEDVREFLDEHRIRYSPLVKLSGRSGFDHAIDFLIPKSPSRPERFVKALNVPNKATSASYLFLLTDVREVRGSDSEAYAFLNDRDRKVSSEVVEAFESYSVKPVMWSRRKEYVDELAA